MNQKSIFVVLMVLLIALTAIGFSQDHVDEVITKPLGDDVLEEHIRNDEDLVDYFLPAAYGEYKFVTLYDEMSLVLMKKIRYNGLVDVMHIELYSVQGKKEQGLRISTGHFPDRKEPIVFQEGHGISKKPYLIYTIDDRNLLSCGNTLKVFGTKGSTDSIPLDDFGGVIEMLDYGDMEGYTIYSPDGQVILEG